MSGFSVKKPYTVFVGVIIIIVLGIVSFKDLTTDLLPNMELPYVAIITTYPGASPEKVEESVSKVIEQGMMGVSNIENVTSTSSENYSMVMLEFSGDSNMDSVMIEISQKLDIIKANLEEGVATPTVMQINPDMMPVLMTAVDMKDTDIAQLTEFVEKTLIPELESVDGVASVETYGATKDEIIVKLNQDKIDDINDKMLENVSSELAKTKRELDSAQGEIKSGKEELEKTKTEKTKEIADGISGIESGREEITKAEIELNGKKTELENSLSQIISAETEMEKQKQTLEKQESDINSQIEKLEEQKENLEERKEELRAKQKDGSITGAELIELANTTNNITKVDASINAIKSNEGYISLTKGLKELNEKYTELKQNKEQLNLGLSQMDTAQNEINSKKSEIDSMSSMLQVAQATLTSETTKAATQLETAEEKLKTGKEEFEKARDEAYKKASLDGIITADLISQILTAENFSMPAGYIDDNITVKVGDKFSSVDEIKNLVLFSFDMDGLEEITLEDLADIEVGNNGDEIYAKLNQNNGMMLSFSKQSTASTKKVSEALQKRLKELEEKYDNISFTNLMDQGVYIDMIIGSVMQSLVIGGILAIIVLFIFLKELKPTIIIAISIPVSLVFAIAMMYFTGISINIMSLSGLALGVGMLVDNSIVVIENIYRLRKEGKETKEAAVEGAKRVANAIIASTLTTICVFLPIVFVHGMSRQLFQDIGLTIAYSLVASLIIALTVVPAMASKMFNKVTEKENKLINKITNLYVKLLEKSLKLKAIVITLVVVLLGTSIYLATRMDIEFVPDVASDEMTISITMPENSTIDDSRKVADTLIERMLDIKDIYKIGAVDNNTVSGPMSSNSEAGISMYILLGEERTLSNDDIAKKIEEFGSDLDCEIEVSTSNMDMSAMMSSGISLKIKGNDLDKLKEIATDVEEKMSTIDGIDEIVGIKENSSKEQRIEINKNKAMKYGLTIAQIYSTISSEIKSELESTKIEIDNKEYQVVIEKPEENQIDLDNLMDIELEGKENEEEVTIKLSKIAKVEDNTGLENITRENNNRYVVVSATVKEDSSMTEVSRKVESLFKDYDAPDGYKVEIEGEMDSTMEYMEDLFLMIGVAILFIYLIMVSQFQSFKLPFIVMFTMPLAFTGGLLGLYITGTAISIIAMIGFLVLAGIVVNNGIVFIDCVNQLVELGKEKKEAILLTGKLRLRPILMTALTTILGLLSMSLGIGKGSEMTQPLGIVAIGGLLYATILTLFFVPVLYDLFYKNKKK